MRTITKLQTLLVLFLTTAMVCFMGCKDDDDDDDDDIDDDQEEDNETDTDDDQDEQKQEETVQAKALTVLLY